jgi:hypothetical protein
VKEDHVVRYVGNNKHATNCDKATTLEATTSETEKEIARQCSNWTEETGLNWRNIISSAGELFVVLNYRVLLKG